MSSTRPLSSLFTIAAPIIQAPMVGVSTPELAAAVCEAGGIGSIGLGAATVESSKAMIRATKAATQRPFNVNLFCHKPATHHAEVEVAWLARWRGLFEAQVGNTTLDKSVVAQRFKSPLREIYTSFLANEDMLKMIIEERPGIVSFHMGLPDKTWIPRLKSGGNVILASSTNCEEADLCVAAGVDAIVAQGYEAGGHRGVFDPSKDDAIGTMALLQLLVSRHPSMPIIAAGGIMDGKGIAASLRLGASAVQLGTAFLLCPESSTTPVHRRLLVDPTRSLHTRVTAAVSGRPARGLPNQYFDNTIDEKWNPAIPEYPIAYDAQKRIHELAASADNHDFAGYWAGQGASLCRSMEASKLVAKLNEEFKTAMASL